jgi:hypothetical protein
MNAMLHGGPANGRVIKHPNMWTVRIPVQKPISVLAMADCVNDALNPEAMINYDIAQYQFSGQASVTMDGEVIFMFYRYVGME